MFILRYLFYNITLFIPTNFQSTWNSHLGTIIEQYCIKPSEPLLRITNMM